MDITTLASVLVAVFATEAAVGIAVLAAVIVVVVHGLLKQIHHVDPSREATPR